MKLIKSKSKAWAEKEGYSKKVLLEGKSLGKFSHIQELKIKPGDTAEEHYHKKQTEVFYFFNKDGYWIVNGEKISPDVGDVLIIEPLDMHSATSNGLKNYVYLAVKFNYDPDDLYWAE
jgi:gentisate 1,2-dioxygenase